MLCNVCHSKQATIHFKHVSNNEVVEIHLCGSCAQEKGINLFAMEDVPFGEQQYGLADLLAGFTDMPSSLEMKKVIRKCPNCGVTYTDFKKSGRLGCSECYKAFKDQLAPLLGRLQGSTHHKGKIPEIQGKSKKLMKRETIGELKVKLRYLIKKENHEEAAVIRDRIKDLEKKMTGKRN